MLQVRSVLVAVLKPMVCLADIEVSILWALAQEASQMTFSRVE